MIYSFKNDYNTIASKEVMDNLIKYSEEQNIGYGCDYHTENAIKLIKKELNDDNVQIHLLIGGTSTNTIAISSILRPYEAVIAVKTAHINVHETGAIEATGHKIITTQGDNGKITVKEIKEICALHNDNHMVMPRVVYISNSTEIGTIYTLSELKAIYEVCHELGLYLYLDGARLASALTSEVNDIALNDLTKYTDMFYIGATKNGGAIGEALIIVNDDLKKNMDYMIKNKAGLLAKGFITGIVFETLFTDKLYFKYGKNANICAMYIKNELLNLGYKLKYDTYTNQIFVILPNNVIEKIKDDYLFEIQEKYEDSMFIRLCCSYDTKLEMCKNFINDLKRK
ncbi:MAG: threonine aldolase family protein [Anaeroplasmataceae bacterium]